MSMNVKQALNIFDNSNLIKERLQVLKDLGLGYLTLGEAIPKLSGGEAQRLKLSLEIGKKQDNAIFVFDEPTIGLHPLDVHKLLNVFQNLIDLGATIIVIEHDLDFIKNADYIIDMGPDGGKSGVEIICSGTIDDIIKCVKSKTGKYLREYYINKYYLYK